MSNPQASSIPGIVDPATGTAVPRNKPYTWSTWIARLLGEWSSCQWATWFRSHYTHSAIPADYDQTRWRMDHSAMLQAEVQRLQADGRRCFIGKQNRWQLVNPQGATLAGQPDIAAIDVEGNHLLVNVYPGQPQTHHTIDMILAMHAWSRTRQGVQTPPPGRLVYAQGTVDIPPEAIDAEFLARFKPLMRTVIADAPPPVTPSYHECKFCNISKADCALRVDTDPAETAPPVPETVDTSEDLHEAQETLTG